MSIAAGLASIKAAVDLTKTFRDAAKAGALESGEIVGRIGEIYDYIVDSKAALIDAQEIMLQKTAEIMDLNARLRDVEEVRQTRQLLEYDGQVYWKTDEPEFPFCAVCWDTKSTLVRLQDTGTGTYSGVLKTDYRCIVHKQSFYVPTRR